MGFSFRSPIYSKHLSISYNNPERSLAKQQEFLNRFVSLPFDDEAALIYSRIRAQLAAAGTPIGS